MHKRYPLLLRLSLHLLLLTALCTPVVAGPGAGPDSGRVAEQIRQRILILQSEGELAIQGEDISSRQVLPALYEKFAFQPLWGTGQPVSQLFAFIEAVEDDGLSSADYHFPLVKSLWQTLAAGQQDGPVVRAEFDLLLTDALVRIGYHLLIGKVDPVALDSHWNMDRTVGNLDQVIEQIAQSISGGSILELLDGMRPQTDVYARMRSKLVKYRAIQAAGGWQPLSAGEPLRLGMSDPRVLELRRRLLVSGDLSADGSEEQLFDQQLEEAVMLFQRRHALPPDGVVGNLTRAALNRTVKEKIDQIRVNLERARWVLHDLPDKLVLVDIAGFQASFMEDQDPVFQTRAQVGTPYRMTPVFKSKITYLELNPTWTVPKTIFREDILPKVQRDQAYLERKGLRVITYGGEPVATESIDWSSYPEEDFPYLLRQSPGPENPLGQIKFMFPNEHAVYLHDTLNRSLFEENRRAFSSGCVRIEKPFALAELLLNDPQWSRQELQEIIETRETRQIPLKEPVTVLLLYWTIDVSSAGRLIFKPDIYERDQKVLDGLNAQFSFRERPVLKGLDFL